jgi:hypothetical protein
MCFCVVNSFLWISCLHSLKIKMCQGNNMLSVCTLKQSSNLWDWRCDSSGRAPAL